MDDFDLVKNIPTEVLEAELERRKDLALPEKILNPDWESVYIYVEDALDDITVGDGIPKDFENNLMQIVMEAMYGEGIWKWWNAHQ